MLKEGKDNIGVRLKLIDIQTLSEYLSVKPKTIYDWIYKGRIPYYKIGGLVRFNYEEIKRWLAKKRKDPRYSHCDY